MCLYTDHVANRWIFFVWRVNTFEEVVDLWTNPWLARHRPPIIGSFLFGKG